MVGHSHFNPLYIVVFTVNGKLYKQILHIGSGTRFSFVVSIDQSRLSRLWVHAKEAKCNL